jgi:hypothetical protein
MIHIEQRDGIAVLIVIKCDTNFVKEKLDIKFRSALVHFVIHCDLPVVVKS